MELNFQKIVLIIAAILLIIMFVIIIIVLSKLRYSQKFPPIISNCPDYWEDKSMGNSSNCVNIKGLGTCGTKSMDFSGTQWTSKEGLCNKARWARYCNLTWDGITNNSTCLS